MSDKNIKALRKQVRNVAQENLPGMMRSELFTTIKAEVLSEVQQQTKFQLEQIQADINKTLAAMEKRSQDVQTFIMNHVQSTMAQNVTPEQPLVDPTAEPQQS